MLTFLLTITIFLLKISFQELTDLISKNWATIDEETKNYCQTVSEISRKRYKEELNRYNAAQKILELQREKSEMTEMREKRMALFKPKVTTSPPRQTTSEGSRKVVVTPERLPWRHQPGIASPVDSSTGVPITYKRRKTYIPPPLPQVPPPLLPYHAPMYSATNTNATIPFLPVQIYHTQDIKPLPRHHDTPLCHYRRIENFSDFPRCERNRDYVFEAVNWCSNPSGRTHTKPRIAQQRVKDYKYFNHQRAFSGISHETADSLPGMSSDVRSHPQKEMMTLHDPFQQRREDLFHESRHRHEALIQNKQNDHVFSVSSTEQNPFQGEPFHDRPTLDDGTKKYDYIANAMWCYSAFSERVDQSQILREISDKHETSYRNEYWKPSCDTMTHDEAMKICDIIGAEHSCKVEEKQTNTELYDSFPGNSPCRSLHHEVDCSPLFAEGSPVENFKNCGLDEHDIDEFICDESHFEKDMDCDLNMPWV